MRLPLVILGVLLLAIGVETGIIVGSVSQPQVVVPAIRADNAHIIASAPEPVSKPPVVKPVTYPVNQTVPLVVDNSISITEEKPNETSVVVPVTKADGKWQLAVDSVPRLIRVDLARQGLQFYRDGKLIYEFKCSSSVTGKIMPPDKHPDPPHDHIGVYDIQNKILKKWSKEWKVWMPNALQYHNGHYIHATLEVGNLGHRASHGCIRLSLANAKTLYAQVQIGDPVEIE